MMYLKICLVINVLYIVNTVIVEALPVNETLVYDLSKAEHLFKDFIAKFNKKYKDEHEYKRRLDIFKENLKDIDRHNIEIDDEDDEVFGITEFSDLTYEEFVKEHTGLSDLKFLNETDERPSMLLQQFPPSSVPDSWDWRSKNVVDMVRNQGSCGACWAFSVAGVVYAQVAMKHQKRTSLSIQQMVDCFRSGNNHGCRGGWPHLAFKEAASSGGLMVEADYPYKGREGKCRFSRERVVAKLRGGQKVGIRDEEHLKRLVHTYGPVAVGIFASHGFQLHRSGIATAQSLGCYPNSAINHAVILVGYGTEHGHPYWIIQNSFGSQWGEQGYIKLERGRNACGILQYVATADVV